MKKKTEQRVNLKFLVKLKTECIKLLKDMYGDQNIQEMSEIVRKDRHLSVRMIADMVGINRETVQQTLRNKRPNLWKNNFSILY